MKENFTANEACEYLGIHKQSLEKYQRTKKLLPDVQFDNGERMYYRKTLDAFKQRWQSPMMTLEEVGKLFGVPRTTVRYHFKIKRSITADADRGMFGTYTDSKVLMVARSAGWVSGFEQENVGSEQIGVMYVEALEEWLVFQRVNRRLLVLDRHGGYLEAKKIADAATIMRRSQIQSPQASPQ